MAHLPHLITDLALILGAAAISTLIFKWLKQPLVLGYIIAGFIVGPYFQFTPTVVDKENVETLAEMGVSIEASDEALDWLAQLGHDPQFGARPLKRVIQKRILNELSKQILAGKVDKDSKIKLDMFDNNFVFLNTSDDADRK